MIKAITTPLVDTLETLPKDKTILDVGGASSPFGRATALIDIVPYEAINWSQSKGGNGNRVKKENFTQHDICSREAWPFKDKQFDFSVCSHVLEDIRDPLWVCSEMMRVSKAGYIEVPTREYETTFGIEIKNLAGASHHRWIVDLDEKSQLRFTFKYMQVHSPKVNKNRTDPKHKNSMFLRLEWRDDFTFYENWLGSGKEIFEYYRNSSLDEKQVWKLYRDIGPRGLLIEWLAYWKKIFSKKK